MSQINVIQPSVTILPDSMSQYDRVRKNARICYRSEAAASDEADAKMVAGCINRGHTSVTEHGFMSVFLSDENIDPKVFNIPELKTPFSTRYIWSMFRSPDINKYLSIYTDDTIYQKIEGPTAQPKAYPVILGDFRAWMNVLDDCLTAAVTEGSTINAAFICGIIVRAYEEFPVIFKPLVDAVNNAFSKCMKDHFLRKTFKSDPEKDGPLVITDLAKFYNAMKITVAQACPRATLSIILRTDRATTHQLVRHRRDIAYSQESQRYCNYMNKGYDVIWPAVDPVKFAGAKFPSVSMIPEGKTEAEVKMLDLEPGGYLPKNSSAYHSWLCAMDLAISHYEALQSSKAVVEGEESKELPIPPEIARMVLPNSFATTIGVTYTPGTFVNVMKWRLDSHAQWQIRSLLGTMVITALRMQHAFFENFPPKLVLKWIGQIRDGGICTDAAILKEVIDYQNSRQKRIDDMLEKTKQEAQRQLAQRKPPCACAAQNK